MALLMCRPEFFDIEYEINPWMHVAVEVDHERAVAEWEELHRAYVGLGQEIALVAPVDGLPDMVFTANAAVLWRRHAVLSRFQHAERAGEESHWRRALTDLGFEVHDVAPDLSFEGAGDALDLVRARIPRLIEVSVDVAAGFACNAMPVGDRVVSSTAAEALRAPLASAGFDIVCVPMDEFMKSGGGVRCLSLPLDAVVS